MILEILELSSKPLGFFLCSEISPRCPSFEVVSAKRARLDPRAGLADRAQQVAVVTREDLPRWGHQLEAHGAIQVLAVGQWVVWDWSSGISVVAGLVLSQEGANEVLVDVSVGGLTDLLLLGAS